MFDDSAKRSSHRLLQYLACYTLWIGHSALWFWIVLQARYTMTVLAVRIGLGRWVIAVANKGGMLLVGMLWLAGIILLEDFLRKSVSNGRLRTRTVRILLYEAIAIGIVFGLRLLIT